MHLENLKVRVKKYPQGYCVEVEKTKRFLLFFTIRYWIHIESVSGMPKEPWFFRHKESAIGVAVKHFHWDLIINSDK